MTAVIRRAAAVLALPLLAACSAHDTDTTPDRGAHEDFAPASLDGLRVLLGNDDSMRAAREDGSDGLGLYELRSALCAAGADVVVFAPWGYQSSMSGAVSHSGSFGLGSPSDPPDEYADDCADAPGGGAVHGVCVEDGPCEEDSPSATPVDSVTFALHHGLRELVGWSEAPDVVVSGVNSGPNVATQIPNSGTVGAALAGQLAGVPSLAVSASVDEDLVVTPETYSATAAFTADLLARLHGADLLTSEYLVNVNHPHSADGEPASDVRWTEAGTGTVLVPTFTGEDTYELGVTVCGPDTPGCLPETKEDADSTALLTEGAVSVSALTSDRTYASGEDPAEIERLAALVESLGSS
ncbi:5'/3'-nucleotidase SurE [Nocardiopsis sp. EMB25]|uniref:5'/3'-nucleotidase SurE n=1 Tax=Nocardiopsis TaxID=2013 RepID=UPI0003479EDC|nr:MULTISPECIES: 5'/3'-nucleotidase SurE [Nocardiopsis]MCY9787724.1 5'/3'-nucleotidase SurE [Nocardiopsis sp. EMB25]